MKKTITRWALHKIGTEQLGYLCPSKDEAEKLLENLHSNASNMSKEELKMYEVAEVTVTWNE